jgi:catechol 2,3-dioxygenase-like lactoylglutathione lyase family enzyme
VSKLPVGFIEKSVWFYKELLGLTIKKQSKEVVVYQGVSLHQHIMARNFNPKDSAACSMSKLRIFRSGITGSGGEVFR